LHTLAEQVAAEPGRARPVDGRVDTAVNLTIAGMGPKRFAGITRFQRLPARLGPHERDGWARIALQNGCYDSAAAADKGAAPIRGAWVDFRAN